MIKNLFTTMPVEPSNTAGSEPEFGRWRDVERLFGIKRGKLYELTAAGLVRSVSLRRPGQKHSCRLWHLASIRHYLEALMEQETENRKIQ